MPYERPWEAPAGQMRPRWAGAALGLAVAATWGLSFWPSLPEDTARNLRECGPFTSALPALVWLLALVDKTWWVRAVGICLVWIYGLLLPMLMYGCSYVAVLPLPLMIVSVWSRRPHVGLAEN